MPIKDFYCRDCETVSEHLVKPECETWRFHCERCGKERTHHSICNGGAYLGREITAHEMYHHLDKHISFEGIKVGVPDRPGSKNESKRITPTTDLKGRVIHDKPRFSTDAAKEKQQRRMFNYRKKADRQKISFTATSAK